MALTIWASDQQHPYQLETCLEMHICGLHARRTVLQTLWTRLSHLCFNKSSRWSDKPQSLRPIALEINHNYQALRQDIPQTSDEILYLGLGRSSLTWWPEKLREHSKAMKLLAALVSGYTTFYLCALGSQFLNLFELTFLICKMGILIIPISLNSCDD